MKRLTKRPSESEEAYLSCERCGKTGIHECWTQENCTQTAVDRLAEIEDILGDDYDLGRLKVLVNQCMTMREEVAERFSITKDIPVDRLREMAEADRDGRCVVLPCKVGDKIYKLFCGEVVELEVERIVCWVKGNWKLNANTDKKYRDWKGFEIDFSDFDKTVFLTCEAAEAALKGEQHDNSL